MFRWCDECLKDFKVIGYEITQTNQADKNVSAGVSYQLNLHFKLQYWLNIFVYL